MTLNVIMYQLGKNQIKFNYIIAIDPENVNLNLKIAVKYGRKYRWIEGNIRYDLQ